MCFSTELLRAIPHRAYSVVEDVEYGLRLGESGHRVYYADEAHVYGEMVTTAAAANSQRRRWEEGRKLLVRANAARILKAGLARRDRVLFDLGLDLIIPPLSTIAVVMVLGSALGAALRLALDAPGVALSAYAAGVFCVALYVLRGWSVSGTGARGLLDLALAPVYVIWKIALRFTRPARATSDWVRTKREAQSDAPP
jgi:1,2-diacylglycerol 3-beta-glucosyltransferase